METACFLAGLGSQVSVVVRSKVLRTFDQQVVRQLEEHLSSDPNLNILNKAKVKEIQKKEDGLMDVKVQIEGESEQVFSNVDCVVLAVGREFVPKHIGLDSVKDVSIDSRRYVIKEI
jgi:pyruvate/2-oxoglutarate dehydrogenase complex dihydrolipoamide dehydrogenase (E3) component